MTCLETVDRWCPLALRAAAFVQAEMAAGRGGGGGDACGEGGAAGGAAEPEAEVVRIMYNELDKDESPYLASTGRHGLQIEVGPTPQGVLRHDVVARTERALHLVLEFLERRNAGAPAAVPDAVQVFSTAGSHAKLAWPVDGDGFPTAVVHRALQGRDWTPIGVGHPLFETLDGDVIAYEGEFGPTAVPIFVNEGGYYGASSGRGIGFAVERTVAVPPDAPP